MSDSRLLNENTIRRFMKLANVEPLTNTFISERAKTEDVDEAFEEEETLEEETEEESETLEEQEEEELASDPAAEEPGEMDMDMDMDMDDEPAMDEPGAADISLTEEEAQLLIDLGERLQAAMGADQEPDDEGLDDMDAMEDDDMADMGADEEEVPAKMHDNPGMQESIVNEVLKRVTKRILASKKG